jgi:YidC/Oxa1 family membrane protein insertase
MGPKTEEAISAVDSRLNDALGYAGFLSPIARLLFMLLKYLYTLLGNFGWAIIALTILIKLILLPFTFGNQQRLEQSKEFSKKMTYIKQRYKDNPERLQQEQLKLMKEGGMPGLGCLPILLQIPIFISIRGVIASSFELYGASFLWIPDLSGQDPYYILPILVVFGMLVQAMYADKSQRMMFFVLAIVFGALMSNFSAGLALYFVVTNVLTLVQTQVSKKFSNNNGVRVRVR